MGARRAKESGDNNIIKHSICRYQQRPSATSRLHFTLTRFQHHNTIVLNHSPETNEFNFYNHGPIIAALKYI